MELPPFALSRLANLTHAVAARLSVSASPLGSTVLRELDIELEPKKRNGRGSFFAACSSHGNSRRLAPAAGRARLTLQESVNFCSCASSTCAHRFKISQDRIWNLDETAVRMVPAGERGWTKNSRVSLCLRLARLRHGHSRCEHEGRHVDADRLRGEHTTIMTALCLCVVRKMSSASPARACMSASNRVVVVCCCFPSHPSHLCLCCVHSSRFPPVPSLALRMGSNDQCDGNQCCPSFGGCLRWHHPGV